MAAAAGVRQVLSDHITTPKVNTFLAPVWSAHWPARGARYRGCAFNITTPKVNTFLAPVWSAHWPARGARYRGCALKRGARGVPLNSSTTSAVYGSSCARNGAEGAVTARARVVALCAMRDELCVSDSRHRVEGDTEGTVTLKGGDTKARPLYKACIGEIGLSAWPVSRATIDR
eukprot:1182394-Prorocentrum_minimum.AAC.3